MIYPWQTADWQRIQALRVHWPHALLVVSEQGMGEREFIETLAQSFLCQHPNKEYMPCGQCQACTWFLQGAHPDYQMVLPEILSHELNAEKTVEKKSAALSKEIKIDQIRELSSFCYTSAYAGGKKVVLIYPVQSMNVIAANGLLKMLEEPPANVLFILAANRIDSILPTIVSRCQIFKLSRPKQQEAYDWLNQQVSEYADDYLAQSGGAPLAALQLASHLSWPQQRVLEQLILFSKCDVLICVQLVQKTPLALIINCLQKWCYDLWLQYFSLPSYYFPHYQSQLSSKMQLGSLKQLNNYIKLLGKYRLVEEHPLNASLAYEDLFRRYQQIFLK